MNLKEKPLMRLAWWCLLLPLCTAAPVYAVDLWGEITAVGEDTVTIRLQDNSTSPASGDLVEITTSAFGEELVIGLWRVEQVLPDEAVMAAPEEVLAAPEPGMRAVVHVSNESRTNGEE